VISSSIAGDSWKKRMQPGGNEYFTVSSVQQNSFDLIFKNLGILFIQHLRRVVPRLEVLHLPEKCSSVKQIYLKNMFRKDSKSVCSSTVVLSADPLYYTP
jgi:hypothetical protein